MIETGQPIAMRPMPTEARPSARTNGPASTTACRRSSRQTRSQAEVTMASALSATGERSLVRRQVRPMQMRELARAGECEGNRALELHEPERFQQIRHRRKGASVLARRQDARTDDREVLEPAPEPGCRCQAGRRGGP